MPAPPGSRGQAVNFRRHLLKQVLWAGLATVSECRKRRSKISLLPKWLSVFRAPYPTCYNVRAKHRFFLKNQKNRSKDETNAGGPIWRLDRLSKASVIFPSWPTSHGLVPPDRFCWQRPRWNCANRMRPISFVRAPHKRTTEIGQQRRKVSWIQVKGQEVFRQVDF